MSEPAIAALKTSRWGRVPLTILLLEIKVNIGCQLWIVSPPTPSFQNPSWTTSADNWFQEKSLQLSLFQWLYEQSWWLTATDHGKILPFFPPFSLLFSRKNPSIKKMKKSDKYCTWRSFPSRYRRFICQRMHLIPKRDKRQAVGGRQWRLRS